MRKKNEAPNYDIENQHNPSETSMSQELANLSPLLPLRCIYRVPERLRRGNENAYTPRVVSIGPLHHGKEHLKAMEEHKKRYLAYFLHRTQVSLNNYINKIKDQEARLRSYYADFIEFDSDEFVRIILVDAAFIIEFLLRKCFLGFNHENDYIFEKPWMKRDISPDLRMLENQLPFFILKDLFVPDKLFPPTSRKYALIFVSYFLFKDAIYREGTEDDWERIFVPGIEVNRFVDFMRILCQPMEPKTRGKLKSPTIPNMAELHQAGVKFKVGTSESLFDIKFSSGVLEIPKLKSIGFDRADIQKSPGF
ncbi:unnamed protein product [Prunus armeniaca]